MRRLARSLAITVTLALTTAAAVAQLAPPAPAKPPTVREQEIAACLPGELKTWGDGIDTRALSRPLRFAYRHDGAPPWFGEAQVLALVNRAAQAWSPCGVPTKVLLVKRGESAPDGAVQILWSETGAQGNAGAANLPARSLSLSPGIFRLLRERRPDWPGEKTLQMTLSHEMGHFYGLGAHSRRCVDVMSNYTDARGQRCALREPSAWGSVVEYRSELPTACDIARCKALNP